MSLKTEAKSAPDKIHRFLVKLTIIHSLSFFLFVAFVTMLIYWGFKRNLEAEDDQFLTQKYESVQHLLDLYSPGEPEFAKQLGSERGDKRVFLYVRIKNHLRETVFSTSQKIEQEISGAREEVKRREKTFEVLRAEAQGNRKFRIIRSLYPSNTVGGYYVEVWMDRTGDDNAMEGYGRLILFALVLSLILSPTIGYTLAKKALRPVEENMKKLARFSDDLAHELRTPLNNLRGEMELCLSRDRESAEYVDTMSSALEELDRMKKIIDGLLFVTRVEQDQFTLSQNSFLVHQELASVVEFYGPTAEEKNVKLTLKSGREDLEIKANRALFQQAIGNLVANAIKFTQPEGNVEISYRQDGPLLRVSVEDTGMGIDPNHVPRVFDRFYRIDFARSRDAGGLGLGLAIAKSISEVHGGSIAVESAPGQGSKFTISFRV